MKRILAMLLLALIALPLTYQASPELTQVLFRQYNILFIIADDLRIFDNKMIIPNLRRLEAESYAFDRAFNQFPLCNPSRTSIFSGTRPETNLVWDNDTNPRTGTLASARYIPEFFKDNGYWAAGVSKITHGHIGNVIDWDAFTSFAETPFDKEVESQHPDYKTAQTTRQYIFQGKAQQRPWFIAVGFQKPHIDYDVPQSYFDMYPISKIQAPPSWTNGAFSKNKKKVIQGYYACTSFLDNRVGEVLQALKDSNQDRDTIIVFTSDHGFHLFEHNRKNKKTLWLESARGPLLVFIPGTPGGQINRLVELVDIYPTLLDLTGYPIPQHLEGLSFYLLFANPERAWKKAVFTSAKRDVTNTLAVGITDERFSLLEEGDKNPAGFFDWQADPFELVDRLNDPLLLVEQSRLNQLRMAGWRAALPD